MMDVASNRKESKWTRAELLKRVLWRLIRPLFCLSPRPIWGWRRFMLRAFGARVGDHAHIYPSVRITIPWNLTVGDDVAIGDRVHLYALGPIVIGDRATVSQGAHLCAGTHDWRDPTMPLIKSPITLGSDVWICADAFVGPGVTVGEGAIVGARAVAVEDVPIRQIVAGNPAKKIGMRDQEGKPDRDRDVAASARVP